MENLFTYLNNPNVNIQNKIQKFIKENNFIKSINISNFYEYLNGNEFQNRATPLSKIWLKISENEYFEKKVFKNLLQFSNVESFRIFLYLDEIDQNEFFHNFNKINDSIKSLELHLCGKFDQIKFNMFLLHLQILLNSNFNINLNKLIIILNYSKTEIQQTKESIKSFVQSFSSNKTIKYLEFFGFANIDSIFLNNSHLLFKNNFSLKKIFIDYDYLKIPFTSRNKTMVRRKQRILLLFANEKTKMENQNSILFLLPRDLIKIIYFYCQSFPFWHI